MKNIRIFHILVGLIPFAWFISFLLILIVGFIKLGQIPGYGNPVDPYALNIGYLSFIHFVLFTLGYAAFILWPILTMGLLLFFKRKISIDKLSAILFIIGVAGYFIFRYYLTNIFLWVVD